MSDFFSPENEEDQMSRFDKLGRSGAKKRGVATVLAVVVTLLVLVAVLAGAYYMFYPSLKKAVDKSNLIGKKTSTQTTESKSSSGTAEKASKDDVELSSINNILVVGVEDVDKKQVAKGLMVARVDLLNKTVQAVNIPERTYVDIEGLGLDQINKVYAMGMTATKDTIENLIQVPMDGHVVLGYDDFQFLVSENRFKVAFEKATETSYSEAEAMEILKVLRTVDMSKSNIMPLPVQYITVNGEPFFEPDNEALSKLLDSLWRVKIEVKAKPVRVMVLNGNGTPGIGKTMADQLSASGYVVSDIRNASNFKIKTTSIVAYKEDFVDKAKAIKKIVGVGNVVVDTTGASPEVVEIVVIIGHDYKPPAKSESQVTTTTTSNP